LNDCQTPGTFATRRTGAADDLHLEVKGVGRITYPVASTMARRLCAIGRPARYGLKTETRLEWPLTKDSRAHIHQILDSQDLPVTHTTRRAGRPFTLVLTKTDALFERDAKERELWERDVLWLTKTAPAF
jgi:hypothetical protein